MLLPNSTHQSTCCRDVSEILEKYAMYIRHLARKEIHRATVHQDVLDLEIDELVQRTRIKLWLALLKGPIDNIKAYIRPIVHNEYISMLRKERPMFSLPLDEDGEVQQGNISFLYIQNTDDIAYAVEEKETIAEYAVFVEHNVLTLPPHQRRAMIHALNDHANSVLPREFFVKHDLSAETEQLSKDESHNEAQRRRASLVVAQKKMRALRNR